MRPIAELTFTRGDLARRPLIASFFLSTSTLPEKVQVIHGWHTTHVVVCLNEISWSPQCRSRSHVSLFSYEIENEKRRRRGLRKTFATTTKNWLLRLSVGWRFSLLFGRSTTLSGATCCCLSSSYWLRFSCKWENRSGTLSHTHRHRLRVTHSSLILKFEYLILSNHQIIFVVWEMCKSRIYGWQRSTHIKQKREMLVSDHNFNWHISVSVLCVTQPHHTWTTSHPFASAANTQLN